MKTKVTPSTSCGTTARERGTVFLFQGDSITDGNRGRTGDPNHIMGHGYAFSIASRLGADYPQRGLVFHNRGISGNKVTDLAARWQEDTLHLRPDVLSILVGINDVNTRLNLGGTSSVEEFEATYEKLLDVTKRELPRILLVLCQPFVLPVGGPKDKWSQWHAEVPKYQAVTKKLADAHRAAFVEFQQVMDSACTRAPAEYWMWDGVHPTVAGHELLAREWLRVAGPRLPWMLSGKE